jgi:hypothetical protein
MLGDERAKAAFHVVGKRIIGGALIGKLGMASDRRD